MQTVNDQLEGQSQDQPEPVEQLDLSHHMRPEPDQPDQTESDLKKNADLKGDGLEKMVGMVKLSLSRALGEDMTNQLWLSDDEIEMGRGMGALGSGEGGGVSLPSWLPSFAFWGYLAVTRGFTLHGLWQYLKAQMQPVDVEDKGDGQKSE